MFADGKTVVAISDPSAEYPRQPPFHPGQAYAEYDAAEIAPCANKVYDMVRESFRLAGLDPEHYGSARWNPLSDLIHPGETVLLKPNFVKEHHPRDSKGWQYIITHGSIIRAVADYVFKAVGDKGHVVVADAPQTDSSFDRIRELTGLDALRHFCHAYWGDFQILDLRKEQWTNRDGVVVARKQLAGDPQGYAEFDLGQASEFTGHRGTGRYYGADYDDDAVNRHHSSGRHEYLIARTAIKADVIFSLPKLKTHKKAGITVSLKNLVGINGDKNWLPHHTMAGLNDPGDERPSRRGMDRMERAVVRRVQQLSLALPYLGSWIHRQSLRLGRLLFADTEQVVRSGNWWGNDTTWRMCLDLNKIALYGNPDATLRPGLPANRKRHYVLVDGIIAGEGRGPMNPDAVPAALVVFGTNPASVDAACALLMGFDPEKIPIIRQAFRCHQYPLAEWGWHDVRLMSNRAEWNGLLPDIPAESTFRFEPHFGWSGHIERAAGDTALRGSGGPYSPPGCR